MPALILLLVWCVMSAAWNVAGVALLSRGRRAPGPVASTKVAIVLVVAGLLLVLAFSLAPIVFILLALVAAGLALQAIANAFPADPSLCPADFWRYAGVAINGLAVAGALLVILPLFAASVR